MAWGQKLAKNLKPGQLIELVGDLGGGKTTIVKGIAKGLGIKATITSPTFNIHRTYQSKKGIILDHFDLYRLDDDSLIAHQINEKIKLADSIIAVEWAKNFTYLFDDDRLLIKLNFINQNTRELLVEAKGPKSINVIKNL